MSEASIIYSTAGSRDEALAIGRTLVSERLAACANVIEGMMSVYRWQGAMHEDREAVLILKTRTALVEAARRRIRELHRYERPAIVAWPLAIVDADYLRWIVDQTDPAAD